MANDREKLERLAQAKLAVDIAREEVERWKVELDRAALLPPGEGRERAIEAARKGLAEAEAELDQVVDAHWDV